MKKLNLKLFQWLAAKSLLSSTIKTVKLNHSIFSLYHSGRCPESVRKFIQAEIVFAMYNGYYVIDTTTLTRTKIARMLNLKNDIVGSAINWLCMNGYRNIRTLNIKLKSRHDEHNVTIPSSMICKLLCETKTGKATRVFVKKLLKMVLFITKKANQKYIFGRFVRYNHLMCFGGRLGKSELDEYRNLRKEIESYGREFRDYGKSYETIAAQLHICVTTAVKYVKELVKIGAVNLFHNRQVVRVYNNLKEALSFIAGWYSCGLFNKKLFIYKNSGRFTLYTLGANIYTLN